MKQRFAEYLQRADGKQSLVDDFARNPGAAWRGFGLVVVVKRLVLSLSTYLRVERNLKLCTSLLGREKSEVLSFNLFTEEYPDMRKQDLLG